LTEKCVIIGCGSHSNSVISIVESSTVDYKIIGLIDTASEFDQNEVKGGYRVISTLNEMLSSAEKYKNVSCFIAVGDNHFRKKIFEMLKVACFRCPNLISDNAFIDRTVAMGEGNVIAHGVIINAQAKLGSNNLINTKAIVEHDCVIDNHTHIAPNSTLCGSANIYALALVGAASVIMPKVVVKEESIIGAGATLVTSTVSRQSIYVGNPAKLR
jgi:sugar O-acyltransferase (sialic acid O-acetyltransferase NeuD family)